MILVLITCPQKAPWKINTGISCRAKGLNAGLSLHLHPNFVYMSSERSGETVQMCRLVLGLAAGRCDKYKISCTDSY